MLLLTKSVSFTVIIWRHTFFPIIEKCALIVTINCIGLGMCFSKSIFLFLMLCVYCIVVKSCELLAVPNIDRDSIIFNIANNISSAWNVYGNTLTIVNIGVLDNLSALSYNSAVELLSPLSESIIENNSSCEGISSYDRTAILLILREFKVNIKIDNIYKWPHYKRATLLITFIYSATVEDQNFLQNLLKLFYEFGSRGIIMVVIIVWSELHNAPNWFTFNYYSKELFNETGTFDFRRLYYRNTQNFHGLQIKSCVLHHEPFIEFSEDNSEIRGPDMKAFYTLMKFLNISSDVVKTQPKNTSTFIAAVNYAKNNSCDMLFTKSASFDLPGMVKMYYPIRLEHNCILVPKGGRSVGIFNLLTPFHIYVWYAVLISFCLSSAFWFKTYSNKVSLFSNAFIKISYLDFIKIQLNMPVVIQYRRLSGSIKIFIVFSTFYASFLVYAYQSVLYGFLVHPSIEKDLNTLHDIKKSGIKIFVQKTEFRYWKDDIDDKELLKLFLPVLSSNNFGPLIEHYHKEKRYGYTCRESWALSYLQKNYARKLPLNVHLAKECMNTGIYTYKVSCNFPFLLRFEQVFRRFEESGINSFWSREFIHTGPSRKLTETDNPTVLKIEEIIGPIIFWCLGCIVAIITFCLEYYFIRSL